MSATEKKLDQLNEYQKQMIDIENYKYYQHAIDVFFYPAERLNLRLKADLQALRAELVEDGKTTPPFVKIPISKYSDKLTEILDYYINEGKFLGRPYPHLGKRQVKNSTTIIVTLESIKNMMTDAILEENRVEDTLKQLDSVDKLLAENITLSKAIIEDISKKMTAINIQLGRDYSKYSLQK
ncbi:hypothetical protein [Methanimicrococcus blatticola]|uniref:Uncharacterized protein n=1 Tax=Methanimicrococcus blatticola TaxID=91560 RepID=A0A484F533_9EURY|nr:hypothetical protein [Methanimicrococcus blatticola]MBZ3935312.1 hypothetical protein [Methanimicrococcus blatticola]MCC2508590.1 hypothetical protein [Methanimicrococcus blatticola]TDQ67897.1 hypothetical protein C7391_1451 [Methanimicrococcus blatticola]